MANETILRKGFIAKAASEVEGTLGAEALAVINSSGSTLFTLPTADGTAGYAMTTNGSGTLSWSAIPSITGLLSDITNESIHELSDVEGTSGLADGDVLQWNNGNSQWEHVAATSIGTTTLAGLTDTTADVTSGATDGDFLRFDGSDWSYEGLTNTDITSGMVTQYQGSINIAVSQVTDFDPSDYVAQTEVGAANGVASLDASGLVPSTQLPSYVDDIIEFDQPLGTPGSPVTGDLPSGETASTGKLYVDTATDAVYRYSGSAFVNVTDFATPDHNISTHGDVTITAIAAGELLKWNGSAWINNTPAELGFSIDDLSDVNLGGDTTEDKVLAFDSGGDLVPTSIADLSTSDAVSSLTDVTLSALGAGEILYSTSGSSWVNRTPTEAGLALSTDIANMVETTDSVTALNDVTNIGSNGDIIVNNSGNLEGASTISHDSIANFDAEVNALIGAATLADLTSGSITDLDEVSSVGSTGQILISDGTDLVATDFTDWKEGSTAPGTDAATSVVTESTVGGYAAVTVHYSLSDGTNMRTGTLMAITDGASTELTDISTNQIGSEASEPIFTAITSGSNIDIKVTDGNGYTIKTTYRIING